MANDQVIQDLRKIHEELREKCRNDTQAVRKDPETEHMFRIMYFGMKELDYRQNDLTRVHKIGHSVVPPREVDNMRIFLRRNHLSRTDTMKCLTDVLGDVTIVHLDERQEWTRWDADQYAVHPEVVPGGYQLSSLNSAQLVEGTLYGTDNGQDHFVGKFDLDLGSLITDGQALKVSMAQFSVGDMPAHSNDNTPNTKEIATAMPSFGMQSAFIEQCNFNEIATYGQAQGPLYHWRENGWFWLNDRDI